MLAVDAEHVLDLKRLDGHSGLPLMTFIGRPLKNFRDGTARNALLIEKN
jgi:hypothetical protein